MDRKKLASLGQSVSTLVTKRGAFGRLDQTYFHTVLNFCDQWMKLYLARVHKYKRSKL